MEPIVLLQLGRIQTPPPPPRWNVKNVAVAKTMKGERLQHACVSFSLREG